MYPFILGFNLDLAEGLGIEETYSQWLESSAGGLFKNPDQKVKLFVDSVGFMIYVHWTLYRLVNWWTRGKHMLGRRGPRLLLWSEFSRRWPSLRTLSMKSRKVVAIADSYTVGLRYTLDHEVEMWFTIRILILNIPFAASLNNPKIHQIDLRRSNFWSFSQTWGLSRPKGDKSL